MAEPAVADTPEPITVVSDPPVDEPKPELGDTVTVDPQEAPKSWVDSQPDGWREELATKDGTLDEARLNHLKRVGGIPALIDNYFAAQDKIRSGEIEAAKAPDEHSTADEWTAYREEQGIPSAAEGYEVNLDEGLVLGDEDKEILDRVFPVAHEGNLSSELVSKLTNAMLEGQQEQYHKQQIQQEAWKKEADTQVRSAWKGDYEVNKNMLTQTILGSIPESRREAFGGATMADGRMVFNDPEMLIAMADWARTMNPSATVVPNTANPMQAITNEIAELEARMGDREWFKDGTAQARYQQLITARQNLAQ